MSKKLKGRGRKARPFSSIGKQKLHTSSLKQPTAIGKNRHVHTYFQIQRGACACVQSSMKHVYIQRNWNINISDYYNILSIGMLIYIIIATNNERLNRVNAKNERGECTQSACEVHWNCAYAPFGYISRGNANDKPNFVRNIFKFQHNRNFETSHEN